MAEILINKIVDKQAIEEELSFVRARVVAMEALIKRANESMFKMREASNWGEYVKEVKQIQAIDLESAKVKTELAKATKLEAQAREINARAARQEAENTDRSTKATERATKAKEKSFKADMKKQNNDLYARNIEDVPFTINAPNPTPDKAVGPVVNAQELAEAQKVLEANAWAAEQLAESAEKAKKQVAEVADAIETGATSDWLDQFNGSLNDNLQLQTIFENELSSVNEEIKFLNKNTSDADKQSDKYTKKLAALKGRQTELKRQLSDVNGTIKQQTKEYNSAEGSLERLRARLALTQKAYDNLGDSVKKSNIGQGLLLQTQKLTNEIKAQEGATGRFQRNVGNYGSAIANGVGKAFGAIKTIANILPGLGVSGVFLAIYQGVKALADISSTAKDRFDTLKNSRVLLGDAMKENSIKDAVSNIKTLEQEIKLAKEGVISKELVLKKYNETVGKTTGEVKSLDQAEQDLVKNTPAYLQMLLKKTVAQKAYDKAAELLLERQKEMVTNPLDLLRAENEYDKLVALNNPDPAYKFTKDYLDGKKKFIDNYNEKYRQGQKLNEARMWEDIGDLATKEAAELAKRMGFIYESFDDKEGKRRIEAEKKAAYELAKYKIQLAIDEQKAIAGADGTGAIRIKAREDQARLEMKLAKLTHDYELSQKDLTRSGALKIGAELAQAELVAIRKRVADIALWAQLERIARVENERKTLEEMAKLQVENDEKERQNRINSKTKDLELGLRLSLRNLDDQFEIERKASLDNYKAGKTSKEKYEKEQLEIQNKYNRLALIEEINYYSNLLTLSGLSDDEKKKALEKFYALSKQLRDQDYNDQVKNTDKEKELHRKKNEAILALSNELRGFVFDLFKGGVDRQINEVQGLIDELEKQKQKEIEVANSSITNSQERADAIAVIEARANAQREQYEQRQRQLNYEKAKYERQAAITEIIQNTAVAAMKAFTDGGWVMSGLAIALGAAQLARVLATPIPRYKYGTDNHPGGPAIVGDGGKSEAVVTPDGETFKTPSTATMVNLPKGTQVYPDYSKYMMAATLNSLKPNYVQDASNKDILKGTDNIVKAISKLPGNMPRPVYYTPPNQVTNWMRR